jgi:hypothetical protein
MATFNESVEDFLTPADASNAQKLSMVEHTQIDLRKETQQNPVADEVSALIAVVRPILLGLLFSLKADVAAEVGGPANVKLKLLHRLRLKGDGDVGICYEYAVHDAVRRRDPAIMERVSDALRRHCKVPGRAIDSILFGAEKTGAVQLIDTARAILTDDSRILTGMQSQPPKLKSYLNMLAAAFSRPSTRLALPYSINGLWKADLFLGCTDSDRWIGTTVKINAGKLEGANGLRLGIVPASQGRTDRITRDDGKNLIVCPLPYDGSFMETFYYGWGIVQQFLQADAEVPKEVFLPTPSHRQVARELASRREHPVLDVVHALEPIAQPELLTQTKVTVSLDQSRVETSTVSDTLIAPISRSR